MKELLKSNDPVLISFTESLLRSADIDHVILDQNMSIMEGSIGILPRRIMVASEQWENAKSIIDKNHHLETNHIDESQQSENQTFQAEHTDQFNHVAPANTTDDLFLDGLLRIYQPEKGFRSGIDSIFLASSVPLTDNMKVLEAGCGAGVVSLAIAARCPQAQLTAIEIEPEISELCQLNINRNKFDNRMEVLTGDICDPVSKLEIIGLKRESYSHVVANPPFYQDSRARASANPLRKRAHISDDNMLENWVRFLTAMAAPKAYLNMIHRADYLPEILRLLEGRFGNIVIYPLFPSRHKPASRILIQGQKGSRAPMTIKHGLVIHDDEGNFTQEAKILCLKPQSIDLNSEE